MTLSEIVSITGMPGLYKASGKRTDGLIATSLVDGSTKFVSGRVHLFSTLDNITIYTNEGSKTLKEVLAAMKEHEAKHSTADLKTDDALKAYFGVVVPDYDREKFYVSHMKKLVGWYNILNNKGLIAELTSDTPAEGGAEADTAEVSEKSESKKATKVAADKADKTAKPKKEAKVREAKPAKAATKAAGGGARKTVTPRKAS
jgi:hypothetical protein